MILDDLDRGLQPIVQVIDDWNTDRKLGLVFEARVGQGKLLVCSIDLQTDLERRPVARQMRHSLLSYMSRRAFKPRLELEVDAIGGLFKSPAAADGGEPAAVQIGDEPPAGTSRRQQHCLRLADAPGPGPAYRFTAVAELDIITD